MSQLNQVSLIDLLRHGETKGSPRFCGSTDDPLTDNGWTQMWATVKGEIKSKAQLNHKWNHIISSPLSRCSSFAHALGKQHAITVELDDRIKEMHFGAWEGFSAKELMATDPNVLSHFWHDPVKHTPPNAEPLADFQTRVLSAWREIIANHATEKILLITHGGVMRVILCNILQHPIKRLLEIEVKHAALRCIRVEHAPEHIRAELVNESS